MSATKIDPILLSVYARTFKSITDEMSISMEQTTRSPILCEAKDYVTGLYDADGNMLEQTENLPILAFSLAPVCKYIKEYFGDEIYPGDVIFHNDVFSLGNQNNDVAVFKPVFFEDKLVAWTAVKGHQADIGGNVAGGYNPNAVEVWQEALRIPPVKVVERGKGDGVFITTTGVGILPDGLELGGARARPGDAVIISGSMGDHGVAIMSKRENLSFDAPIESDTAALNGLIAAMLATGTDLRCLRDPTRGGLAATLNEIAGQSGVGVMLHEKAIPVKPVVSAACEFLGLDPLYVANEGKLIAICAPADADRLLASMRAHPLGREASRIGEVIVDDHHFVQLTTAFGGKRIVDWLAGDQLPRIC